MEMTLFPEEFSCWMTLFLLMMNDTDLILMAISRLDIDIKMIDNDACMSVQNISYIDIMMIRMSVLIVVCSWPAQPTFWFISELIVTAWFCLSSTRLIWFSSFQWTKPQTYWKSLWIILFFHQKCMDGNALLKVTVVTWFDTCKFMNDFENSICEPTNTSSNIQLNPEPDHPKEFSALEFSPLVANGVRIASTQLKSRNFCRVQISIHLNSTPIFTLDRMKFWFLKTFVMSVSSVFYIKVLRRSRWQAAVCSPSAYFLYKTFKFCSDEGNWSIYLIEAFELQFLFKK